MEPPMRFLPLLSSVLPLFPDDFLYILKRSFIKRRLFHGHGLAKINYPAALAIK
jgi:hypothetical protein